MTALLTWAETDFFRLAEMSGGAVACLVLSSAAWAIFYYLRCSKRIPYLLLLLVLARLLLPVELSSPFSLFNTDFGQALLEHYTLPADAQIGDSEFASQGTAAFDAARASGVPAQRYGGRGLSYVVYTQDEAGAIRPAKTFRETYGQLCGGVWLLGFTVMMLYGIFGTLRLKRRVSQATRLSPGVYESDRISSPFILGLFRPRIYLPLGLDDRQRDLILCHERAHIRWGDVQIKALFYLAMCLHWFNPFLWLWYFRLLPEVMEEACDQSVLRQLGEACRADYSQALLAFGQKRPRQYAMTVAFGENDLKDRIRLILKGKLPWRWLTAVAALVVGVCAVTMGTDAVSRPFTAVFAEIQGDSIGFSPQFGDSVGSAVLELEYWSGDGLLSRTQLFSWEDTQLPAVEKSGLSMDFQQVQSTLTCQFFQGETASSAALDVPESAAKDFLPASGLPRDLCRSRAEDGTLLLLCRVWGSVSLPLTEAAADPVLEPGSACLLLRLRLSPSVLPDALFTWADLWPAGAEAGDMTLFDGDSSKRAENSEKTGIFSALQSLSFTEQTRLGFGIPLDRGDDLEIDLALTGQPGRTLRLVLSENALSVLDSGTGQLVRWSCPPMVLAPVRARVLEALGESYRSPALYDLPQTVGNTNHGWTLAGALPQLDAWLYADAMDALRLLYQGQWQPYLSSADRAALVSFSQLPRSDGEVTLVMLHAPQNAGNWADLCTPADDPAEVCFAADSLDYYLPVQLGETWTPQASSFFLEIADQSFDFPLFSGEDRAEHGEYGDLNFSLDEKGLHFTAVYSARIFTGEDSALRPCLRVSGTALPDGAGELTLDDLSIEPLG